MNNTSKEKEKNAEVEIFFLQPVSFLHHHSRIQFIQTPVHQKIPNGCHNATPAKPPVVPYNDILRKMNEKWRRKQLKPPQ
jgi:hypothetical protein